MFLFPELYVAFKAIPREDNDFPIPELTLCFFCALEFWRDRSGYRLVPFASEHNNEYCSRCDRCNAWLDW